MGQEAGKVIFIDFVKQIGAAIVANTIMAVIIYYVVTKPIKTLSETMQSIIQDIVHAAGR